MGIPVISEGERREFRCLHRLEKVDPAKEQGFRWHCLKCGKWMYRKNGVVVQDDLQHEVNRVADIHAVTGAK